MAEQSLSDLHSGPLRVEGTVVRVVDRLALRVPLRHSLQTSQGVRLRASIEGGPATTVTAIPVGEELLLLAAPRSDNEGLRVSAILTMLPERADVTSIPKALALAAHQERRTFEGVSEPQIALMVTMVRESASDAIAALRIARAVASLPRIDDDESPS